MCSILGSVVDIRIEGAGSRRIATPVGKSGDLEQPDGAVERNCDDVADLDAMAGRLFPDPVDADMTGLNERSRTGASLNHPRMP